MAEKERRIAAEENLIKSSHDRKFRPDKEKLDFPSCRQVLTVMIFIGHFLIYSLRVNLSVSIIAMVNSTYNYELISFYIHETNETIIEQNQTDMSYFPDDRCRFDVNGSDSIEMEHLTSGMFKWNTKQQGMALAAFFYGCMVTELPGGLLAQRFGGKLILLLGVSITSLLTLLTPALVKAGDLPAMIVLRILEGMAEGATYPATFSLVANWAAPFERSKMTTAIYAGAELGVVTTMISAGMLCHYLNWESVFYITGSLGAAWSIVWFCLAYDKPAEHPRISEKELNFIENSIGTTSTEAARNIPWLKLMTSVPVYALLVGHFCNNWGYYILLTCLPLYLNQILHFSIKSNGFLSGLPNLASWACLTISSLLVDKLLVKKIISTTVARKAITSIGFLGASICLVCTGYVDCNTALAVALVVVAGGLGGMSANGWAANHLDVAPPYSGTLHGITSTIATTPGFIGPTVVGALTYQNQTVDAWRTIFFITAAIYVFGTVFYLIFASGEKLQWVLDMEKLDTIEVDEEKEITLIDKI